MIEPRHIRFPASKSHGNVSGILLSPNDAHTLLALGHGAGAGMGHPFLEALARKLADLRMATFRYQFPYMEAGKRRPDFAPVLQATVRSAVAKATELAEGLPVFAGGKSMGGRMTSLAAAREPLAGVRGLAFFGFPLHPAGRPGTERAEHLNDVAAPMLFLQGTRDRLAQLELLEPIVRRLGALAEMLVVDGADHSFAMLKKSGRSQDQTLDALAVATTRWAARVLEGGTP